MKPKLLLVNFSESDAVKIADATSYKVIRGYLKNTGHLQRRDGSRTPSIKFFSPESYYECSMVFINLDDSAIPEELELSTRYIQDDEWSNFMSYWFKRSHLFVVYTGDTDLDELWQIGIPLRLESSKDHDTASVLKVDHRSNIYDLIKVLQQQIKLPAKNLTVNGMKDDNGFYSLGTDWRALISNYNGDVLASALSKETSDIFINSPGALILPTPKSLVKTTSKIVDYFTEYYEIKRDDANWLSDELIFPERQLAKMKAELTEIETAYKVAADTKNQELDAYRTSLSFLGDLVTQQGDKLVDAVHQTLTQILKMDVTKSDEEKKNEDVEDLLAKVGKRNIVIEVKGTASQNPPLDYPSQPFRHIARRGYGAEAEACLILNHDLRRDPAIRKLAYSEKDKQSLIQDICFVDTRVLLTVAKAVLDDVLSPDEAVAVLFSKRGRSEYPKAA